MENGDTSRGNPAFNLEISIFKLNAANMQFGICNEIFKDWKIEDAMAFAAQAGYSAIEIAPFTISKYVTDIPDAERRRIKDAAKKAKIAISGIHWVLAETEGLHLTHPDPEVRKRTSTYLGALVEFCNDLGGNIIVLGSPKQRSLLPGVTREKAVEWARETMSPAVRRALDRGITICFEPLAPTETDFINTAKEAIQFIRWFRSPSLRVILDVKAMSSEGRPIPEIIRESWPSFAYFHANDKNLKGPGFGQIDFKPIAQALKDVGYEGYVSVEVFNFDEGPEVIATKSIEYLKATFDSVQATEARA